MLYAAIYFFLGEKELSALENSPIIFPNPETTVQPFAKIKISDITIITTHVTTYLKYIITKIHNTTNINMLV